MSDEQDRPEGGAEQPENTFTYGVGPDGHFYIDGQDMGREGNIPPTQFEGENVMELEVRPGDRRKYTEAELIENLQRAEEAQRRLEQAEPLVVLSERRPEVLQRFLEWQSDAIESGEIEPPRPPAPTPDDIIKYERLSQEPDFEEIRSRMRAYAETLPEWEKELLTSNHRVFCDTYAQMKAAYVRGLPKKELERRISQKEVLKERGRVEGPGSEGVYEPTSDDVRRRTRLATIQQKLKGHLPPGVRADLETELARFFVGDD